MKQPPDGYEWCPECGGYGGCPGSDFGDYGWHPCFYCGTDGVVKKKGESIEVEIREHLHSTPDYPLWTAIITVQDRSSFAVYAGDKPSEDKVRHDWFTDRNTTRAKNWLPYHS